MCFFFFFKQKTSYEMRISDWSSDVCSSDLFLRDPFRTIAEERLVVDAELGDAGDERVRDDVGRVEPPAEPDLDDAGVGGGARESEEGDRGRHLEEARLEPVGLVERFLQPCLNRIVVDKHHRDTETIEDRQEHGSGKRGATTV